MKQISALFFSLILGISLFSQVCIPNPIFTQIGIWPIAAEAACQGEPYEQTYTIVAPTVIDAATVKLLTNGAFCTEVTLCSFSVGNFQGFPEGLTIECLEPSCEFDGGGTSCLLLSGTTNVPPGVYNVSFDLIILIEETFCFVPLVIPINQGSIVVQSPGSCTVGVEEIDLLSNVIWSTSTNELYLSMDSEKPIESNLNIYSVNGQLIYQEALYLSSGSNSISIPTSNFADGIYLVEFMSEGQRQVIKTMIGH